MTAVHIYTARIGPPVQPVYALQRNCMASTIPKGFHTGIYTEEVDQRSDGIAKSIPVPLARQDIVNTPSCNGGSKKLNCNTFSTHWRSARSRIKLECELIKTRMKKYALKNDLRSHPIGQLTLYGIHDFASIGWERANHKLTKSISNSTRRPYFILAEGPLPWARALARHFETRPPGCDGRSKKMKCYNYTFCNTKIGPMISLMAANQNAN